MDQNGLYHRTMLLNIKTSKQTPQANQHYDDNSLPAGCQDTVDIGPLLAVYLDLSVHSVG